MDIFEATNEENRLNTLLNMIRLGVGDVNELTHSCIGLDLDALKIAKRLAKAQLVLVENSNNGPMVTRTFNGTRFIRNYTTTLPDEELQPAHE